MNRVRNVCARSRTAPNELLSEIRDELLDVMDSGMPDGGVEELAGFMRDVAATAG